MQREDEGGAGGGVPGWQDHGRAGGGRGGCVGLVGRSLGFLVLAWLTVALLLSQYMGPSSLVPTQRVYDSYSFFLASVLLPLLLTFGLVFSQTRQSSWRAEPLCAGTLSDH